jgi:hypothetical protein
MVRNCACHASDELKVWGALIAKRKSKADMMTQKSPTQCLNAWRKIRAMSL